MSILAAATFLLVISFSQANIFSKSLFMYLRLKVLNIINASTEGTQCATDLKNFFEDLQRFKPWAVNMFDASSKIHPGIIQGNNQHYGNLDQCLSVEHITVSGQYCTASITPNNRLVNMGLEIANELKEGAKLQILAWENLKELAKGYFGVCVPKSCTVEDLDNLYIHLQKEIPFPFGIKFSEGACIYSQKPVRSSPVDVYVFFFFCVILVVEVLSTAFDLYWRLKNEKPGLLVCFSFYTNLTKLMSTHTRNDALTSLYGIKVLSILWVLCGHLAITKIYMKSRNGAYIVSEWTKRLENTFFSAAPYSVDTFFSISGILVIYMYMKYSEKFKINVGLFYLHRLVRLVPALLAAVLINASLVKYWAEGQQFSYNILYILKENCDKRWWACLLFLSNRISSHKQCILGSWFLAVDTQMYFLSPLLLLCFKKNPNKAFFVTMMTCTLIFIYVWNLVVRNNYGFILGWELVEDATTYTYFSTVCRMPPFLIGICCGYLLYKEDYFNVKISKKVNLTLWTISLGVMLSLILYHVTFFRQNHNVYRSAFFNTFSRSFWSLSVCYIIFSCCTGRGGFVNTFLSHPIFKVLGKLTYCIFLVHFTVIHSLHMREQQTTHVSNLEIFYDFWSTVIVSVLCATVLNLMFEVPFISLLNQLETHVEQERKKRKCAK